MVFIVIIQLPEHGNLLSQVGNSAKRVNGSASAMAKPAIPTAGAIKLPTVDTSTSKKPIIGPVQENDTSANVKAIKNMLMSPVVRFALASTALVHDDGKLMSKAPKNENPNAKSINVKNILKIALVESALSAFGPAMYVIDSPKMRYITIIDSP